MALKVLPPGALLSESAAERFAREAATAGRLHHSNIVPVYGVGETDGIHFYAMQFIEGRSLSEHLKAIRRAGTVPGRDYFRRVARWGRQAAEALAYAHGEGTIHRDIKPSNLLLDARDNIWLTDFGLARVDALTSITVTGDVVGTARYMSPEQARGGRARLDERTDIYSLGATLYELLCLTPAFEGESREAVLNRIAFADPKRLRQIDANIPRDLETIVAKCMENEPQRRYPSAADVAEDCRRYLSNEPIRARRTPVAARVVRSIKRHPVRSAGVFALVILAASTVLLMANSRRLEGERYLNQAFTAVLFDRDFGQAAHLLDQAESVGHSSVELDLYRGLIPLFDNQPRRALPHLERALRVDPDAVEVRLALALMHNATGDFFDGERVLNSVPESETTTALAWLLRGLAQSKTDRSAAIAAYDQAIALHPDFTPAISARAEYRGTRLLTEGRREELEPMLNDFDALVVFRPHSAASYVARAGGWLSAAAYAATQPGMAAEPERWLANCRADLVDALALREEDDSLPLVRQGVFRRYLRDYSGAAESFAEAIRVDRAAGREPHPYRIHERGVALYALGELDAALNEVVPAHEAAPDYCPLALLRAALLAETGRIEEARAIGTDSLRRQRANANGLFMSAVVMELLGAQSAAMTALEQSAVSELAGESAGVAGQSSARQAYAFLTGGMDGSELLALARDDPGRRCEFAFLIALRRFGETERAAGAQALRTCLDTGVYIFSEYRMAQALLERAEQDQRWPRWVRSSSQ